MHINNWWDYSIRALNVISGQAFGLSLELVTNFVGSKMTQDDARSLHRQIATKHYINGHLPSSIKLDQFWIYASWVMRRSSYPWLFPSSFSNKITWDLEKMKVKFEPSAIRETNNQRYHN